MQRPAMAIIPLILLSAAAAQDVSVPLGGGPAGIDDLTPVILGGVEMKLGLCW